MELPLQIIWRDIDPFPVVERDLRRRTDKLARFCDRITSVRVVVERPQHRRHHGDLFAVTVDIELPGGEIVVNRAPTEDHAHEDLQVAIRDAFEAAERRVQDYVDRRYLGHVKTHESLPEGEVVLIAPDHGFLRTPDGTDVYFHRNSVVEFDFDRVEVGHRVKFVEQAGREGLQASAVHIVRPGHPRRASESSEGE